MPRLPGVGGAGIGSASRKGFRVRSWLYNGQTVLVQIRHVARVESGQSILLFNPRIGAN